MRYFLHDSVALHLLCNAKNISVCPHSALGQQLAETETYSLQRVAVVEELQCAAFSQKSFHKYHIGVRFTAQNIPSFTV